MKSLLVSLGLLLACQAALADSYWHHNGSVVRLSANGDERAFFYDQPSEKMRYAGVDTDTLLFNGYRKGDKYYGTARVFSKYCENPLEYPVSGHVTNNQTKIVLTGQRTVYKAGCHATGKTVKDTLVFTYAYSD